MAPIKGSDPFSSEAIAATRHWVEALVVGESLCPFAGRELENERVRFTVTDARDEETLLEALKEEMDRLDADPAIETTLLIHPHALADFLDYNDFLSLADALLAQAGREGVYQVASFHPGYRFADSAEDDAENYTNRSPYPMLHLLREASVERAIDGHPDIDAVPSRNIGRMNELGRDHLQALLVACLKGPAK